MASASATDTTTSPATQVGDLSPVSRASRQLQPQAHCPHPESGSPGAGGGEARARTGEQLLAYHMPVIMATPPSAWGHRRPACPASPPLARSGGTQVPCRPATLLGSPPPALASAPSWWGKEGAPRLASPAPSSLRHPICSFPGPGGSQAPCWVSGAMGHPLGCGVSLCSQQCSPVHPRTPIHQDQLPSVSHLGTCPQQQDL